MALALIGIVVLSYSVWAHHMFVAGMFSWLRVPMMITTLLIAVADRDQDLLLARDAVRGGDPSQIDGDAVRPRLHSHLHDRRHLRA